MPDASGWQFSPAHIHPGRRLSPPGRGLLPVRGEIFRVAGKNAGKMRFANRIPKGRVGLRWESSDVLGRRRIS